MKMPVFVAIDTNTFEQALLLAREVSPRVAGIKLGLEFFCNFGCTGIARVMQEVYPGTKLFLDLKFKDIPATVIGAIGAIVHLRPDYLSIHIDGGINLLQKANAFLRHYKYNTQLVGISVLTSIDATESYQLYNDHELIVDKVVHLAKVGVHNGGLKAVVCSSNEVLSLRQVLPESTTLIVPGVRLPGAESQDQLRIGTPKQALLDGASFVVVGRHINRCTTKEAIALALDELEASFS